VAEDTSVSASVERCGRFLSRCLNKPQPSGNGIGLAGDQLLGAFEHGRRGFDDRDLVTLARERDALMAGAAADVDDPKWRWWEMGQKMLMDDVGSNSSPQ
jgi:hypothetical protein